MPKSGAIASWMSGALLLLGPAAVSASSAGNELQEEIPAELMPDTNLVGNLIWVFLSLLLVIGMIILFVKFLSQRSRSFGINRSMRTLGGVALGQNKSLQVVELGGKIYIVGVGDDISLLDKIIDPEEVDTLIAVMEQQAGSKFQMSTLSGMLGRFRNRAGGVQPDEAMWNDASASFQDVLDQKMQRQAARKQQVEALLKDSKQRDRLMDE